MGLFLIGTAVAAILLFKLLILAYLLFDGAGYREKRKGALVGKQGTPLREVLAVEDVPLPANQAELAAHLF